MISIDFGEFRSRAYTDNDVCKRSSQWLTDGTRGTVALSGQNEF